MRTPKTNRGRHPARPLLLAALIGVPLLEIALFIKVGGWIGLGPTLALIVLSAVIGAWIVRRQGISVLLRAQRQLAEGSLPVLQAFEGLCLAIAGVLLLLPGFFTDAIGALLLVPAVRRMLYRHLRHRIETRVIGVSSPPRDHAPGAPGPIIDAEYEQIEDRDMPSPTCPASGQLEAPAMILCVTPSRSGTGSSRAPGSTRGFPSAADRNRPTSGGAPGHRLAEANVHRLVTSPYRRALETAHRRNALGLRDHGGAAVRERCVFSCDEGTSPAQLAALWPDLDFAHLEELWWGVPAESEVSLDRRCAVFRAKTDLLEDRSQVAVITHWGVIRALTGRELSNAEYIRLV